LERQDIVICSVRTSELPAHSDLTLPREVPRRGLGERGDERNYIQLSMNTTGIQCWEAHQAA